MEVKHNYASHGKNFIEVFFCHDYGKSGKVLEIIQLLDGTYG